MNPAPQPRHDVQGVMARPRPETIVTARPLRKQDLVEVLIGEHRRCHLTPGEADTLVSDLMAALAELEPKEGQR